MIEKSKNSSKEDEKINEEDILLEGDCSIDHYKEEKTYIYH